MEQSQKHASTEEGSKHKTVDFGPSDGPMIIRAARQSIYTYLRDRRISIPSLLLSDPRFEAKRGCFVTIKENDSERTLRGCIGFPEPVYKLSKAIPEAAISAATQDPRFPPVSISELDSLLLEVSLLTKPEPIVVKSQKELPNAIEVGKDGLILRWSFGSGLLLPQVATEYKWDAEEFLCNVSMKAGAPPDQWLVPGTLVFKFRSIIFQEEAPKGSVSFIP